MSVSPPRTPPSRAAQDDERRFKPVTAPCEWVEDYRPGGYHPVSLDDSFKNGQYKILRKLGDGSYSTVWLVHDLINHRYAALKILVSEPREDAIELLLLRRINQESPGESSQHITQLLDEFEHQGPNGIHKCLVFEPMGPSVNSMVMELPQFKPRRYGMKIRYPPQMAKVILKQSLQALAFLHRLGVAHGDVQPGNMLFTLALGNIDSKPEEALRQQEYTQNRKSLHEVQRLDGKLDKWAPRYLCIGQPLAAFTNYTEGFKIKLSDLGGAYFFSDPPIKPVVPLGLRSPELVVAGEVHKTLDIWSFGCLIFELITGQPLFCIPGSDFEDDDHLLALTALLGPLPDALFCQWKSTSLYFNDQGELYNCQLGGFKDGEEPLMLEQTTMEEAFDQTRPELGSEESSQVKTLIRRILQYEPSNRPTADEILLDPWFEKI